MYKCYKILGSKCTSPSLDPYIYRKGVFIVPFFFLLYSTNWKKKGANKQIIRYSIMLVNKMTIVNLWLKHATLFYTKMLFFNISNEKLTKYIYLLILNQDDYGKKVIFWVPKYRWLINDVTVGWEFDNLNHVVFLSTTKIINNIFKKVYLKKKIIK